LIWATSREQSATLLARRLRLPTLQVVEFGGATSRIGEDVDARRGQGVRRRTGECLGRRRVRDAHLWAEGRTSPTRLRDVNPEWGLVDAHLDVLLQFAQASR